MQTIEAKSIPPFDRMIPTLNVTLPLPRPFSLRVRLTRFAVARDSGWGVLPVGRRLLVVEGEPRGDVERLGRWQVDS